MSILSNVIKKSFWALSVPECLNILETSQEGLSEKEVGSRSQLFGTNIIPEKPKTTKTKIFLDQFKSPLIFILLIAGAITIILKDYVDAIFILSAAFVNCSLGFYQENKAEVALSHLKTYIEKRTRVLRENHEYEIGSDELVPGDIIHLSQGERIPCDARLIYTNNFLVDESTLTGESLAVQKNTKAVNFQAVLGDQKCMVFGGTLIVQGFANAIVTSTGQSTEIGKIASLISNKQESKTPLQKSIISFSLKSAFFIGIITLMVFFIGIYSGKSILEMFLISVAILIAAIPEGLPVAMTVILAVGVQRLVRKKGIIRKLLAAETLGNTTIILTDKTGTITEAKMSLSEIKSFNKEFDENQMLEFALANTDVVVENPKDPYEKWRLIGRPLERAIVKAGAKNGIFLDKLKKEIKINDILPFNSSNKFSAVAIEHQKNDMIAFLGAPDILLKISNENLDNIKIINSEINKLAHCGERILGIAIKKITPKNKVNLCTEKFTNLSFLGIISFKDPIREGVKESIHNIEQAGVKTVIVTGDYQGTAESIAKELGFSIKKENMINGEELDVMSDPKLKKKLTELKIVSRVSPAGKLKIVKAFQETGEVVAMTGDGINDAPSLRQANIGVAMGSGSDVAKETADLVLLDDNYKTIVSAIEEGRRITENTRKVIVYLLISLLDELVLIGGAIILGLSLPINALQILWINFFSDSFPAIAFAFEDHFNLLLKKPKKSFNKLITKEMKFLIVTVGLITSFALIAIYYILLKMNFDPLTVRTFIFASLGSYSLFSVFSIRNMRESILSYNPLSNIYILGGVLVGILLMTIAIYVPFFQNILGTTALSSSWLLGALGMIIINMGLLELGKYINNKKESKD
ncbi:HAD-IC family P-type ATPase [Patescibacteria group bacterium]|nr:HAD-IC family P-type ATPase [Patescibacteria group bacterium]